MSNISTSSCKSSITTFNPPQPFRSRLVVLNAENTFKNLGKCQHDYACNTKPQGRNSFFTGFVDNKERGTQMTNTTSKTLSTNCCVAALVIILLLILCIVSGICFGFKMVESLLKKGEFTGEKSFKGLFHVYGEMFNSTLLNTTTRDYELKADFYKKQINNLIEESVLKTAYIKSEIIAFDQLFNSTFGLVVHFNLYFNTKKVKIDSGHVYIVIQEKLQADGIKQFFKIDPQSLEISERTSYNSNSYKTEIEVSDNATETRTIFSRSDINSERKQCVPVGSRFCSNVFYNQTSFPNIFGHETRYDVDEFVEKHFSRLLDSNCYRHLKHFLCSLLQPSCSFHEVILPCQEFCQVFLSRCHSVIPFTLSRFLHCKNYPSVKNNAKKCLSEPDCSTFLQSRNRNDWICDDISDCRDFSDENKCNRCKPGQFYCGGNICIPIEKQCDKTQDCPNGLDEKHCMFIVNPESTNQLSTISSPSSGVLVVRHQSIPAKICVDNLNYTILGNKKYVVLNEIARTTCEHLNYRKMKFVRIVPDFHTSKFYYHISTDRLASTNTSLYLKTTCQSHHIISLGCSSFVCGKRIFSENSTLSRRKVGPAAWPWHVSIIKDNSHVCDGTLIADQWLLTSNACFQGQPISEWKIRIGTSRLLTISPNEQQRQILSVSRSPAEGTSLSLVQLTSPVNFSSTVRPVCIASGNELLHEGRKCVILSWDKKGEQLYEKPVVIVKNSECDFADNKSPNVLCVVPTHSENICESEELPGSGLMCQHGDSWMLMGVLNWRVSCGLARRPLLYDVVSSSVQWLNRIIITN